MNPPSDAAAVGTPPANPAVAISEVMYHPVFENAAEETHEFIEFHNTGAAPASMKGWRLQVDGKDRFTFPDTATVAPKGFVVIAKNRTKLLQVQKYGLQPQTVLGDYEGELDNGGATVSLLDDKGAVVDTVKYDDASPWPVGADAFGAQDEFLAADLAGEKHVFMGRSLERWSYTVPATEARNWEASPVDGATPGKANSISGEPPAIALEVTARPDGVDGPIKKSHKVRIVAKLSAGAVKDLRVEYFVDVIDKTDEPKMSEVMTMTAGEWTATLPVQADNAIVRYRVLGVRGSAVMPEPLSIRGGDPFTHQAYFVSPDVPQVRAHHVFISISNWTKMWTNLGTGPNTGCVVNPSWDARVPLVFVSNGRVYDVRARYSGSRYQRWNGIELKNWTLPKPSQPAPFKTSSWRFSFPKYSEFEGQQKVLNLNKQFQACPGVLNSLEAKAFWAVGLPTNRFRFARLYINGGYYHYMMEVENIDDRMMEKVEGKGKPVGDLFKCDGALGDEGPWAKGDWSPVVAHPMCPEHGELIRYQTTYERKSHDWKNLGPEGHAEIKKIIEALPAARAAGTAAIKAHIEKYFDGKQLIDHWVIRNFAGSWDDSVHNYFPYKRGSDGKWIMFPQDFDMDWGGDIMGIQNANFGLPATTSFFSAGMKLKSAIMSAYRPEITARIQELAKTTLSEDSLNKMLDEALAEFDRPSWMAAEGKACDLDKRVDMARKWIKDRHAFIAGGVR